MTEELIELAKKIRLNVLDMVTYSKTSHIGAAYSIVEILVILYFKILKIDPLDLKNKNRDKFILSKAHASAALYATLVEKEFFPKKELQKYCIDGGSLPAHLDKTLVPGIEFSLGSLGHGFSVGLGMAISNHQIKNIGNVYVIIGDGECNEGSIWEGVMLASHLKLSNFTAIIDYNKIQSFGRTNDVINQESLFERWTSFGWDVVEVDGHDLKQLLDAFLLEHDKPKVIIAHTVKGKGVSFMENKLEWHYKSPNDDEFMIAKKELGGC
jgi:transketolase